jgi:hypothetical protein
MTPLASEPRQSVEALYFYMCVWAEGQMAITKAVWKFMFDKHSLRIAALMFCAFSAATAAAMDRGQFQNVPPEIREWFENMRSPKGIVWATFDFHRPAFPSLPAALVRRGNITHSRGVIILTATCLVPQAPVAVKLRVSTSLAELSIR